MDAVAQRMMKLGGQVAQRVMHIEGLSDPYIKPFLEQDAKPSTHSWYPSAKPVVEQEDADSPTGDEAGAARSLPGKLARHWHQLVLGAGLLAIMLSLCLLAARRLQPAAVPGGDRLWRAGQGATRHPYLYVSYHGNHRNIAAKGVNQIYRYSLALDANNSAPVHVLLRTAAEPTRLLRGMLVEPQTGDLFVANAYYDDSKLLRFGGCNALGQRAFKERVAPLVASSSLVHPYGLALMAGSLYATTQDTGSIVGFNLKSEGLTGIERSYQFGRSGIKIAFRGLASFEGCLYAAEEGEGAIFKLCEGHVVATVPLLKPIGLLIDEHRRLLFAGSRWSGRPRVVAIDLDTHQIKQEYRHAGMTHPAGIAVDGDSLYVAEQDGLALLEFDVPSANFTRVVLEGLPDDPEWITLSNC
ncbi:hypothetical protein T492DRAFT_938165 [Pavlovales sp. CCMP2436]|nr:hypothetical protein T492DRAFT_938165 [Pavlovales sp. CCMP2436]